MHAFMIVPVQDMTAVSLYLLGVGTAYLKHNMPTGITDALPVIYTQQMSITWYMC